MKTPICNVCVKSDVLCSSCQEKLDEGEISELDVKISRLLHDLSKEHGSLKDSEIIKTYEAEDVIVILTAEGDGAKVVGRNGDIVKELADELGKSIRVVENSEDDYKVMKGLLSPAEVESVNTVFKPDGQAKKIVVDEQYKGKTSMTSDELQEIISDITGEDYTLSFE